MHPEAPLAWHLLHLEALTSAEGSRAALQEARPLLARFPQSETLLRLAVTLAQQAEQPSQALALAQEALRAEKPYSKDLRAALHLTIGRILYRSGQLDQALHHLAQAAEDRPEAAEAWLVLGQVYEARREHRRAVQAYEQACALSPDDALPYERAGMCYKALKDYPRAERAIRHAASLMPSDVRLQRLLASLTALNVVHRA